MGGSARRLTDDAIGGGERHRHLRVVAGGIVTVTGISRSTVVQTVASGRLLDRCQQTACVDHDLVGRREGRRRHAAGETVSGGSPYAAFCSGPAVTGRCARPSSVAGSIDSSARHTVADRAASAGAAISTGAVDCGAGGDAERRRRVVGGRRQLREQEQQDEYGDRERDDGRPDGGLAGRPVHGHRCTTEHVRVRVMPGTICTLLTMSLPSSSTVFASVSTTTSYGPVTASTRTTPERSAIARPRHAPGRPRSG